MKIRITLVFIMILISSCLETRVKINRDFIENNGWRGKNYINFTIKRLIVPDSIKFEDIDPFDLRSLRLKKVIKIDTNFCYRAKHSNDKKLSKIYFNSNNEGVKFVNCNNRNDSRKKLGQLQKQNWYFFRDVNDKNEYYVFIDKTGKASTHTVNPVNW
ncbi:hypothetical protein [Mesonia maritima]|uniref:Lipoprotein n=1 Tax=Mesonia maritima TaxID=1793873 RepID=A0ABU1K9K8_9FLAO|nr:hypothetical protein [Mesonia maritima]MDR6302303.1 hypothetical protein [Mesonia maritima]